MSSRRIVTAVVAALIAALAVTVPSLAAGNGKAEPKAPTVTQSKTDKAAEKAASEKAEKEKAAKEKTPCPPQSSNGNGSSGGDHPNNGKHCGAEYPPQIGGHG
jgi:hypothetical protein